MSHFTVLVIGDDIEGRLAPYQENNMGDCPEEYLTFEEIDPTEYGYKNHAEAIASDDFHEQDGKAGFKANFNSKWDWWSLGGRWTGFFKPKALGEGVKGGHYSKACPEDRIDQGMKKEIDFEGMRNDAEAKAAEKYDLAMSIFGEEEPQKTIEQLKKEKPVLVGMGHGDLYWRQPRCILWKAAQKERGRDFMAYAHPDEFLIPREEYIANARKNVCHVYSLLYNGEWEDKDEHTPEEWSKRINEVINEIDDDTLISLVDCHV